MVATVVAAERCRSTSRGAARGAGSTIRSIRTLRPLLACLLLLPWARVAARPPTRTPFGVAYLRGAVGCVAFDDAGLKPGESLRLIAYSGESQPRVLAATVGEKLISCDLTDQAVYSDFYYSIRLGDGESNAAVAIAVRDSGSFRVHSGKTVRLTPRRGPAIYFRSCTSIEGLHLTAWSGPPPKGKRIWHLYYYLGYDTVPTCTEAEAR